MPGPLDGVRILDCTSVVLGPWAAQQLGDLDADVIKIEAPEGDTTRQLGPRRHKGMAAFYLGCNRSKRSLVLDLKQEAGTRALYRMAKRADVLLEEEGFTRSEIDAMLASGATMRPRDDSAPGA
jgi:crotonobetainyl-CoA:carnitine CoA-transferase CaiB-like acyl-CoA transferase